MASLTRLLVLIVCFVAPPGRGEDSRATLEIEPLAETLPANFLKFYLHFSEPMARGDVFRYLRLMEVNRDGSEEEVVEPFREVELWSADFQSLTLWLHPGRQKPGVNLNVDLGPVLEEGSEYRLEVSPGWKTETGEGLAGPLSKSFQAGGSDAVQPDPTRWRLLRRGVKTRLVVDTDGALDPVSLRKRLRVVSERGNLDIAVGIRVIGTRVALDLRSESPHGGIPFETWVPGRYRLEVDPELEDLAGNTIARPFNLDLEKHPDFVETSDPIHLSFRITEALEIERTSP